MNNKIQSFQRPATRNARPGFFTTKRGESMSNKKYNCYTITQYVESLCGAQIWQYITKEGLRNAFIADEFAQQ